MKTCSSSKKYSLKLIFLVSLSFFFLFGTQKTIYAESADLECQPEAKYTSGERTTRPAECNICNQDAPLTSSCADSFSVYDKVEVFYPENVPEKVETTWQEEITIDPKEITIPFVGKKNKDSGWEFWEVSNANESAYITDYLEGTNEYYRNYGNQNTITNYQGVLRKLTPYEYQNQKKKELIARAESGEIHDYKVKYISRLCWDVPLWLDAAGLFFDKLTDLTSDKIVNTIFSLLNIDARVDLKAPDVGHYCLYASAQEGPLQWLLVKGNDFIDLTPAESLKDFLITLSQKIPGAVHLYDLNGAEGNLTDLLTNSPPDPNDEDYEEKLEEWKNRDEGYWYRLWQAVPMLSREDTKGTIEPYLQAEHEKDKFEFEEEDTIEGVPHLARLYEGSKEINNILIPAGKDIEMVVSEENLEGECFEENYLLAEKEKSDTLCCESIDISLTAYEEFDNPYYPCQEATTSACSGTEDEDVSRDIGLNLKHPYLDEIWSYTTNANGGFFNIFRPYQIAPFEDIPAADVTNKQDPDITSYSASPGETSPKEGLFYFPHLGGIQKAKEWVVNEALRPAVY